MSATKMLARDQYTIFQWETIDYLVIQRPIEFPDPRTFILPMNWLIA